MPLKVLHFVHTVGEKNGISNHVKSLLGNLPQEVSGKAFGGTGFSFPLFSSLKFPIGETFRALREDFDIMHIHGYGNFYSFFGALVATIKQKPLVWTIHGYPRIGGARRVFYYVYRYLMAPFIFWKASRIISVSDEAKQILRGETRKEILVLPNGVDLALFSPKGSYKKQKAVGYVGRLDVDKGVVRMLECRSHPILFIGPDEGGTKARLESEAARMKLHAEFVEAPYEKMPEEYARCKYIALPSRYEGFPLTLLEAIACERPFISTDVGQVMPVLSELFDKPEKYLLQGNLQQKIDELDAMDLEEEIATARKRAEKYSWKRIAEQTAEIYKGLA